MSSDVNLSISSSSAVDKIQPSATSTSFISTTVDNANQRRQRRSMQHSSSVFSTKHISTKDELTCDQQQGIKDEQDQENKAEVDPSTQYCPWSLTEPLEACDIQGNWYPAKIVEIKDFKVKIHFLRWKKRYDQWFDMDTDLIRRRSDITRDPNRQSTLKMSKFEVNEEVLARWTDTKLYPARITTFYSKGQYCQVLFYDGYRKKVKVSSLQKMPENYQGEQVPPQTPSELSGPISSTNTMTINNSIASSSKYPSTSLSLSLEPFKNYHSFICDTCNKGFRKESLLLQHKKHFHKIDLDIDDVPSLVPPQLRINNKASRHQHKQQEQSDSGSNHHYLNVSNSEKSFNKATIIKSEANSDASSGETPSLIGDHFSPSDNKKRKSEFGRHSPLVGSNENKRLKHNQEQDSQGLSTEFNHQESTSGTAVALTVSMTATTTTVTSSVQQSQSKSSMKSLTVIIPAMRKSSKPNTTLMFRDALQEAEEHENDNIEEFVKCTCPLDEESGLMVQCELCLAWQHGSCAGFYSENDVPPHGYFCQFCRQAPKRLRSQQNSYQLNHWLKNGQHPQFNGSMFEPSPRSSLISATNNKNLNKANILEASTSSFHQTNDPMMMNFMNMTSDISNGHQQRDDSSRGSRSLFSIGSLFESESIMKSTKQNQSWSFYSISSNGTNDGPDSLTQRKSFTLHDLTHSASDVTCAESHQNLNLDSSLGHLMMPSMNKQIKSDDSYFGSHAFNGIDDVVHHHQDHQSDVDEDDEEEISQIRATNQLSSALYDCMVNLHSLNYKIYNYNQQRENSLDPQKIQEIEEQQRQLLENMEMIQQKLEKIEKDIEQKDSYAIHTSSSTLSATSPENFGISSDIVPNLLSSALVPSQQSVVCSGITTPTTSSNGIVGGGGGSTFSTPTKSVDGLFGTGDNSMLIETSTSNASASNQQRSQPTLSALNSSVIDTGSDQDEHIQINHNSSIMKSAIDLNVSMSLGSVLDPEPPSVSVSSQSNSCINQPQALARLFLTTTGGNTGTGNNGGGVTSCSSTNHQDHHNRHISMTHEYLPMNLTDGELKLALSYHYKDLQMAREIVLCSAK